MKTVTTIFLVILILCNTLGFFGLLVGLRIKAKHDLGHRLDNNQYQEEETITLKVPISVPYHMDDADYERVDGEIEHQGEFYRLVKQKLSNDTLYIICIKDIKSKNIKKALADYVKTFTDKPVNSKSQSKTEITFIKDYLTTIFSLGNGSEGWNQSLFKTFHFSFPDNLSLPIFGPPPKA